VRTALFDYALPPELIAQRPPSERAGGRLLVLNAGGLEHRRVCEFPSLVPNNSLIVVNDTRVFNARVLGRRRGTGGRVELLLLRRRGDPGAEEQWEALGRARRALAPGAVIDAGALRIEVIGRGVRGGLLEVLVRAEPTVEAALERDGHVPIPPYVERADDAEDQERYQTVYARRPGSVAAPTAGLHLSAELLQELEARGVEIGTLTLHVGLGTFRPVTAPELDEHVMHSEWLEVPDRLVRQIEGARARGGKVVAVGTTVVRALESARDEARTGLVRAVSAETELFIRPGYRFAVVDALLTNFHMPKSTLLALVGAFVGRERLLDAYRVAVKERYRFLSYGDAMWIPQRLCERAETQGS
jgi:S-adenosylmethionine:tRNA ribosyltransferase-isomerase